MFTKEALNKYLPHLAIATAIILVVISIYSWKSNSDSGSVEDDKNGIFESTSSPIIADKYIFIDISGAVNKPGIYKLPQESRLEDALKAAGGLSKHAYTLFAAQQINLAEKLKDGEKVYIPFAFDNQNEKFSQEITLKCLNSASGKSAGDTSNPSGSQKVNVNTAPKTSLLALPGIGEVYANKIISGRPYKTMDDFYDFVQFNSKTRSDLQNILAIE